jgi:filamentous hemagglutinin family protein
MLWVTHIKSLLMVGLLALFVQPAHAQGVIADQTLPNSSVVTSTGNVSVITGGTTAGRNLFHSFREFSVPTRGVASFQGIDPQVANIFARVTGANRSSIDGLIQARRSDGVISSANLFLLNPHGILFGPNASLNIGGSFLATTGDRLLFPDGTQFTADPSQSSPLLTVTAPIGIQFGQNPGTIENQSRLNVAFNQYGTPIAGGLQVADGQTLALLGGDVVFRGGIAIATRGNVELGSVSRSGQVGLTQTQTDWNVDYSRTQNFGSIQMTGGAGIGALQGRAIELRGQTIRLIDNSRVVAETETLSGAPVQLYATDSAVLSTSLLGTRTFGTGRAGNLYVIAPRLIMQFSAAIVSETEGSGRSGDVRVDAARVSIQTGGKIGTTTFGSGRGGDVWIRAIDAISLNEDPLDENTPTLNDPSQIYAVAGESASANTRAGRLTIATHRLLVQNGAQINASTFGPADAGNLVVRAADIELTGVRLDNDGQPFFNEQGFTSGSGLFAQAERRLSDNAPSEGNGGSLTVNTQRLFIRNGAGVATNTFGFGDAGNIRIRASEFLEIRGVARRGDRQIPSGLYSSSGGTQRISALYPDARGAGGTVTIQTPQLRVLDGAFIGVSSSSTNPNAPGAGQVLLNASTIQLDRGNLNAETESGDLANIILRDANLLTLRNNSSITTSAGLQTGQGEGGNIDIQSNFVVAFPSENNDITANAFLGSGGRVEVTAQRIFGLTALSREELESQLRTNDPIELDPQSLSSNDITAISQVNPQLSGEVVFNTPDVDPSQGIIELPTDIIDASSLISRGCMTGGPAVARTRGEFFITGRGGLSPNPDASLRNEAGLTAWITFPSDPQPHNRAVMQPHAAQLQAQLQRIEPIVEAQGWVRQVNGQVMLVAEAPTVAPQMTHLVAADCR